MRIRQAILALPRITLGQSCYSKKVNYLKVIAFGELFREKIK